jgi:DNA repair protein RadA/Sms
LKAAKPVPLREVESEHVSRMGTGIAELDRVLGGGLVPGSLVLIGGAPGIGKSTLTLAALANIDGPVLYVTGEESPAQVRLRAERISPKALNVPIIAETDVSVI